MNDADHAVAVIGRFYDAEAEYMQTGGSDGGASFDAVAETLTDTVVLHHSPDLPWGGDWHGHEGFEGWAKRMSELNETVEVKDPRYFPDGDHLLVSLTLITRARVTGARITAPMIQQVRVVGDQIADFRAFYWDVPAYLRSYGLTPTS